MSASSTSTTTRTSSAAKKPGSKKPVAVSSTKSTTTKKVTTFLKRPGPFGVPLYVPAFLILCILAYLLWRRYRKSTVTEESSDTTEIGTYDSYRATGGGNGYTGSGGNGGGGAPGVGPGVPPPPPVDVHSCGPNRTWDTTKGKCVRKELLPPVGGGSGGGTGTGSGGTRRICSDDEIRANPGSLGVTCFRSGPQGFFGPGGIWWKDGKKPTNPNKKPGAIFAILGMDPNKYSGGKDYGTGDKYKKYGTGVYAPGWGGGGGSGSGSGGWTQGGHNDNAGGGGGVRPNGGGTAAATTTVPSVIGMPQAAAALLIAGAGLRPQISSVAAAPDKVGQVITQSPAGGTTLASGARVALGVGVAQGTRPAGTKRCPPGSWLGPDGDCHGSTVAIPPPTGRRAQRAAAVAGNQGATGSALRPPRGSTTAPGGRGGRG